VVTEGRVIIGEDALIGSGSRLTEAVIGEGAVVMLSTVSHAVIAPGEHIGPYAAVQE
jgi:bifunctional UDP-N-acetylglucosamine pyrophosphorylase/glucosamine-1-phosphate N-acetyltransferase